MHTNIAKKWQLSTILDSQTLLLFLYLSTYAEIAQVLVLYLLLSSYHVKLLIDYMISCKTQCQVSFSMQKQCLNEVNLYFVEVTCGYKSLKIYWWSNFALVNCIHPSRVDELVTQGNLFWSSLLTLLALNSQKLNTESIYHVSARILEHFWS
jgi:hypothetical protein